MSTYSQFFSGGGAPFPLLFSRLFGDGQDGAATATTTSDVGVHSAFGAKQYTNLTVPAGVTWTCPPGSTNGGLVLAVSGKLTLAGNIVCKGSAAAVTGASTGVAGAGAGGRNISGIALPASSNGVTAGWVNDGYFFGMGGPGATGGHGTNTVTPYTGGGAALLTNSATTNTHLVDYGLALDSTGLLKTNTSWLNSSATSQNGMGVAAAALGQGFGPNGVIMFRFLTGGNGGGGGAATGSTSTAATRGGAGGGGGGVVYIEANTIELVSGFSIDVTGGAGGAGWSATALWGDAGGGAGGNGGLVILACRTLIGSTAGINLAGGAGGAANNGTNVAGLPLAGQTGLAGQYVLLSV